MGVPYKPQAKAWVELDHLQSDDWSIYAADVAFCQQSNVNWGLVEVLETQPCVMS